jgi:putative phosphoesterase
MRAMRLAILSDIHDNLWNLQAAIGHCAKAAETLVCCGDLCSPFVMDQLAAFPGPVHIVFGNNDADLFRITRKATGRMQVYGELFEAELGGCKLAMNHFDYIARPLAASGLYDVVCYGHNHEFRVSHAGRTLAINPGPIMGAKFPGGKWVDVAATFVVLETQTMAIEAFEVERGTRMVKPFAFQVVEEREAE